MFDTIRPNYKKGKFGDKNYKMKDKYEANNLVVARFCRNASDEHRTITSQITEQKYIFELIKDGNITRYREIFTGFIAERVPCNPIILDLPYVFEPQPLVELMPELEDDTIPKLSLLWLVNDINSLKVHKVKRIKTTPRA